MYIPFDRNSGKPFYKQIYDGYRDAILSRRLRSGQRLPSTRNLAMELGISRLPAINAFEQLKHEGYIEGRIGAGTYVKETIPDELSKPVLNAKPWSLRQKVRSYLPRNEHILGPFRVSLPALDQFPHRIWSPLVSHHAKNLSIDRMAYGDPAGHLPLRIAITDYLQTARGVHCEAGQILIVSGSQMALHLCAMALLKPGDSLCMEEPGYPGAKNALTRTGATLIPIPVDNNGISVSKVIALVKRAGVVYVTPSHQYPLGMSMTASRRLELLDWAKQNGSWILEDDYDSEFRYASRPFGALQGMDTASRVIYIGTFSKVLFPSLRIGYIVIPPTLYDTFVHLREAFDIFSPVLPQLVLTDFLQEGHFARHLRRMRSVYFGRRNALVQAIHDYLGDVLQPYNIDAGLHLTAFLKWNIDDCEVVRRAAEQQISASALSICYAGRKSKKGLILGFGSSTERQMRPAAQKLARIINEVARVGRRQSG